MNQEPPPIPQPQRMADDAGMRMLIPVGRSGWAIAASYLGLFSVLLIFAPFSLIISIIAIVDINKSKKTENRKYGMGRAVFGLIMGTVFSVILALMLLTAFIG